MKSLLESSIIWDRWWCEDVLETMIGLSCTTFGSVPNGLIHTSSALNNWSEFIRLSIYHYLFSLYFLPPLIVHHHILPSIHVYLLRLTTPNNYLSHGSIVWHCEACGAHGQECRHAHRSSRAHYHTAPYVQETIQCRYGEILHDRAGTYTIWLHFISYVLVHCTGFLSLNYTCVCV